MLDNHKKKKEKSHLYIDFLQVLKLSMEKREPYVSQRVEETHATIRNRQRNVRGDSGLAKGLLQLLYRFFRRLGAA